MNVARRIFLLFCLFLAVKASTIHRISLSALSGASGSQQEVKVYYPFGQVQTNSSLAGTFAVSRQFTGQVRDDETGLYYYGGSGSYRRYYDVLIDRFIQADDRIPDLSNPQS